MVSEVGFPAVAPSKRGAALNSSLVKSGPCGRVCGCGGGRVWRCGGGRVGGGCRTSILSLAPAFLSQH